MSETIEQVITAIERNRERFEAFCRSLTEEQLDRPVPGSTWIVRDFAAHLGSLDTALLRWFNAVAQDQKLDARRDADGAPFDVDVYNDAHVAERRAWPLDRIFAEAHENRAQLVESLRALTDEQTDRPMYFAGDTKRKGGELPLRAFLVGWAQHDPIHVADMLRALPELQDDAALRAWLDDPYVKGYQAIMNRAGHG